VNKKPSKVLINKKELYTFDENEIRLNEFPAILQIEY